MKSPEEFHELLHNALVAANKAAEGSGTIDHNSTIELHLHGVHDRTIEDAAQDLFIDNERFFLCIDVSLHPKRGPGVYFVRASGHEPAGWDRTRHPETTGPFNIMVPA